MSNRLDFNEIAEIYIEKSLAEGQTLAKIRQHNMWERYKVSNDLADRQKLFKYRFHTAIINLAQKMLIASSTAHDPIPPETATDNPEIRSEVEDEAAPAGKEDHAA